MADLFKILAADKLAPEGLQYIEDQPDAILVNKPEITEDELAKIAGDHDGMIVRSGVQVTAKVMENPGKLKVIARAGVGVDNIDLQAATAKGILVLNSAEASTISTAEHAFTLLMALCRNVGPAHLAMANGKWDRSNFTGITLSGKTLGVVGFGRIGQTVAARAMAFDMSVIAYDPFINAQTMMDGKVKMYSQFTDILPHADILSFHVPMTDETRGMLNDETFALCRKGVRVVNAARGGIVDEQAILKALDSGQCAGVALDVYTSEPPPADSPLRNHPLILTTPHLGASTKEGQQAVSIVAADSLLAYLRGEGVRGAVNAGGYRVDLDAAQTRFVDLADRMATLLKPICTRGIAQVDIELIGNNLKAAAGTIERTVLIGLLKGNLDVPLNVINIMQLAEQRGITVRCSMIDAAPQQHNQITIDVQGPAGSVTDKTHPADHTRHIIGRVYDDNRPRILEINGYRMDMVPTGPMVLIRNEDQPGVIGLVGNAFGEAKMNIADMAISRRDNTALMLLKTDESPSANLVEKLRQSPGILHVSVSQLPPESDA